MVLITGAQRTGEQVAEIARVHLLEEGERNTQLAAEHDIP
jgi:hypothetical protein